MHDADDTTRHLCYSVHLDEVLRDAVVNLVVEPRAHAVCPSHGVDLVALARHAMWARQRRATQDRALMWIRVVSGAVLLVSGLFGLFLANLWMIAGVAAAVLLPALVGAWVSVFVRLRTDGLTAQLVGLSKGSPRQLAPPLDPALERSLDQLNSASNALVYALGEGDPFIGSGKLISKIQLPPLRIVANGDKSFRSFDAVELHRYLERRFVESNGSLRNVRNRLYVRGDWAQGVEGVVPNRFCGPVPVVDEGLVNEMIENPVQRARTYLSVEQSISGGDLVVCLHALVRLDNDLMSVERLIYFLPPLQEQFRVQRDFLVEGRSVATWEAAADATKEAALRLFGAYTERSRHDSLGAELDMAWTKEERALRANLDHDYGARISIREAVASYDTHEHFDTSDVAWAAQNLHHQLMTFVDDFLTDHGVEIAEFRKQVQMITNNVTYDIGNVQAGNAVIGQDGIITGHGQVNSQDKPDQGDGQEGQA